MSEQGMRNLDALHLAKIKRRVEEIWNRYVRTDGMPVTDTAAAETPEHLPLEKARRLPFRRVASGHRWGRPWGTAWFRLRFRVPAAFRGETVSMRFKTGGECLIFRDGEPVQALDTGRDEYRLLDRARGGERLELYVEAGANSAFGGFERRVMELPQVEIFNREVWDAYWDLAALADLAEALPLDSTRRGRLIDGLTRAVDLVDYDAPSRESLREQARRVRRAMKPLFAARADASAQTLACMGHAHIDVAWLWPLAETVRKCGRTFSNVVDLMGRYPEMNFVQSQPQLYAYTRDRYPGLYAKIRRLAKQGRWLPTGCMWVEADCNVTSGESLVRQVLFGTRFFRREFGCDAVCLWLPDVFGYSAALPQILRRSGIRYFLTQKISWNQFSKFPYHSFWWEGIDGSRVLAHFPPVNTYNAEQKAPEMLRAAAQYREKDRSTVQAVPYGYGDGGGGPNAPMLERQRRYRDLEGMPKLRSMSPGEFFAQLEQESARLPSWVGELYLEFHRGTYTTQARNKKHNRLSELRLREAELLSVLDFAAGGSPAREQLNAAWEKVLLNQFHDIIPGSSIDEVYADSERHYAEILGTAGEVADRAFEQLVRRVDTRGPGTPVLAFNAVGWQREAVVEVKAAGQRAGLPCVAVAADGTETPVQFSGGRAIFAGALPSIGHAVFHLREGQSGAPAIEADARHIENDRVRVDFDRQGRVRLIRDKRAGRDVLEPGQTGNRFLLFEDKMATCGEAWDIDIFYNDKLLEADGALLSIDVAEQGPVRSAVRIRRRISRSVITQDVVLTAGSSRIDFVTSIQWGGEKDVLLKVAFPVNVRAATARYEIQYGNVERPTHWNRPQDFGMFEVPAQRWADLSEADYGVALLNDCKYGHDTRGNVMRLTLLRAPKFPGRTADVNRTHTLTYALLPHEGGYTNGVVRAGCELNVPVRAAAVEPSKGPLPAWASFLQVSGNNVVIDAVKMAEDDDGIIVRLYESHGCRGRRRLSTGLPVSRVVETNLMEQEERELRHRMGRVDLDIRPFEIRTLKFVL